jgi:isopenicillin N synthase-like dioxygenase
VLIVQDVTQGARDWHEALDWYRPIEAGEGLEAKELKLDGKGCAVMKDSSEARSPPYKLLQGQNLWPASPSGFRTAYESYVEQMLALGTVVLRAMGYALQLRDPEFFVKQTRKSFWVMRAIGYPPLDENLAAEGGVSCGEHTDYGCLTLLLQDRTKGALEVKSRDGESWIAADPIEGAYVVNVGDMVEKWTAGLVKSTRHRVVHTGKGFRCSVPFFLEPDADVLVKPLDECIEQVREKGGQVNDEKGVTYWDHLVGKVGGNFYGSSE